MMNSSCSKLNRKFHEAQKLIDNNNGGRRIASEGNKKYLFIPKEKEVQDEEEFEEDTNWASLQVNSSSKFDQQLTNSGYEDFANAQDEENEDDMSYKRKRRLRKKKSDHTEQPLLLSTFDTDETEIEEEEEIECRGGGFLVDLSIDEKRPSSQRSFEKGGGFFETSHLKEPDRNRHAIVDVESEEELEDVRSHSLSSVQHRRVISPTIEENDQDDELDDVEWETESINKEDESSHLIDESSSDLPHVLERSDILFSSKVKDTSPFSQYQLLSSFSQHSSPPPTVISHSSSHLSESVLDRAIVTASSMADWAGRVVKRVLKEHIEKEKAEHKEKEKAAALSHSQHVSDPSFYSPSKPLPIDLTLNEDEEVVVEAVESHHRSPGSSFLQPSPTTSAPIWSKISSKIETIDLLESQPEETNFASPHSPLLLPENSSSSSTSSLVVLQQRLAASPSKKGTDYSDVVSPIARNHTLIADNDIEYDPRYDDGYDDIETIRKRIAAASRDTERMTEEMKIEVIELIKAFDLPYIIAPFEAEAQCSILEQVSSESSLICFSILFIVCSWD
jgi:hypothetical protein